MAFKLENIQKNKKTNSNKNGLEALLKKEIHLFDNSFSSKVKEDFYIEMSVLLKAGVNLKEGLELVANSQKKNRNRQIINAVSESLVAGQSISDAIKRQKPFSDYEFYSLKIGEETGTLGDVMEQLGGFYARKNEQRRNLISALTYPVIILTTAVLVVIFMLQFVVPMFQDIFKQQNVELPAITQFIINLSEIVKKQGWFVLVLIVILVVFGMSVKKKLWFKKIKGNIILRIPYIGNFVKTIYLSQFTQAVSLLTGSKVPMMNSIQLVKQMIDFYPLKVALETVEQEILKGASLSQSLEQHELFDTKMVALVKVAEETNQTEFIFERLNHQYNTRIQQQSKLLTTIMEPMIILFVGVLVGVILVAMYLPMFRLSNVIG